MTIAPEIIDLSKEVTEWRRDFHMHPELLYDVHRTAATVEERLKSFGVDEVFAGIGRTGVVGVIRGKTNSSGRVVALRADMDALPIHEETNLPHASRTPGKMHACGHDGHTAMLLGAAKYLATHRDFDGTVVTVFQPAEEGGAGAKAMLDDGLADRFGIQSFYGIHALPGTPVGQFATRPGPIMAATANFDIVVEGKGTHAAMPHEGTDQIVVAAHIVTALQAIASRVADPVKSVVVSVTSIQGGSAYNVIPASVALKGTVRFLEPEVGKKTEERFRAIVDHAAKMFGVTATLQYRYGYPMTVNHAAETELATKAVERVAGEGSVCSMAPVMGGEDFSYMLQSRPGAFLFIGNGDTPPLHNPGFDFNDGAIPYGIAYYDQVVRSVLPTAAG